MATPGGSVSNAFVRFLVGRIQELAEFRAVESHSYLQIRIQMFLSMQIRIPIQMWIRILSQLYKLCKKNYLIKC